VSQYSDSSFISYRPVNFLGFLLSGGALTAIILQLQNADAICPLCSFIRLLLLAIAVLFLLAWLHNPRTFGQRVYNTLNLLMIGLGLAGPGQYLWLRLQGQAIDCNTPLANQLEILANLFPDSAQLMPQMQPASDCYMSDIQLFGLNLPEVSVGVFAILLTLTIKQLRKKPVQRSLFM